MNTPLITRFSLLLTFLMSILVSGTLVYEIGWGGNLVLLILAPYVMGAASAWGVRRKSLLRWIVLVSICWVSLDDLIGLYGAFFRHPARGAFDLVFRPFPQIALMAGLIVVMLLAAIFGPKKEDGTR